MEGYLAEQQDHRPAYICQFEQGYYSEDVRKGTEYDTGTHSLHQDIVAELDRSTERSQHRNQVLLLRAVNMMTFVGIHRLLIRSPLQEEIGQQPVYMAVFLVSGKIRRHASHS